MNLYYKLLKYPVFKMEDVQRYYNNLNSARSALNRLIKRGLAVKIRNDMYTCISGETDTPVANRFQIASAITGSSCVSHHTAMEYYGITDQVFYDVYVASVTKFRSFSFDGYTYRCVNAKITEGVETVEFSGGVRVTDRERTILDSIKDMDKIAGMEEVTENLRSMKKIREKKMLHYLALYDNQFLYQKAGYLLSGLQKELGLTDSFFTFCRSKIGKSSRYLSADYPDGKFNAEWNLVVPDIIFGLKNGELTGASV